MSGFPIRVTLRFDRPPDVAVRKWREIMRAAHTDQGEYWHREYLPGHFKPNARFKYRHKRRTRKYLERKRRLAQKGIVQDGGEVDLVYSGLMRELMSVATIRGSASRATLTMQAPRYVTLNPQSNQPHKAAEVTRVTQEEAKRLGHVLEESAVKQLNQLKAPKTVTA